mmetsp:Transcript_15802/g.21826  ORF Transcript_15802/g.21826 Transcript_15802/m.21826 type:complete len:102 (+) Transcript_15802:2-307(+)
MQMESEEAEGEEGNTAEAAVEETENTSALDEVTYKNGSEDVSMEMIDKEGSEQAEIQQDGVTGEDTEPTEHIDAFQQENETSEDCAPPSPVFSRRKRKSID